MKNNKSIWKFIEPLISGIILALLLRAFIIQAYVIPSASMMDTLMVGDYLIASKISYNLKVPFFDNPVINIRNPKRHDIVIFKYPKNPEVNYIKRVIGLPGESVQIENGVTLVNNDLIEENYATFKKVPFTIAQNNFGPVKVPSNHIFVMGDNRNNSSDSRDWGFVNIDKITGKALIIYWSWDRAKKLPRLNRLFNLLTS